MGLEPTPGPWQGPVLPLYYDRPKHENFSTPASRLQVPIGVREKRRDSQKRTRSLVLPRFKTHERSPGGVSPNLQHARCLNNGRLPLPFGKFRGLCAVCINAGKPLTVFVKNGNLPVFMLPPFVFPELRAFSCDFCFSHDH